MKKQFLEHIKESLENFEVDYDPADWSDLQSKLSTVKAGKSVSALTKGLLTVVALTAVIGLAYYLNSSKNNRAPDTSVTESPIPITKEANENTAKQTAEDQQAATGKINTPATNNSTEKSIVVEEKKQVKVTASVSEKTEEQIDKNSMRENKADDPEKTQVVNIASSPITESKPPVLSASFNADLTHVCAGTPVQFMADNNDASCTYKWYFGDGETSVEPSPKHVYAKAGTYTAKLRITSVADRRSDEKKNTVTVLAAPAVQINYAASEDNNLLINFEADADRVTAWKWDFGDKQTSLEQNPSHAYSKKGNYTATVTAKNSAGCTTTVSKEVNVKNGLNLLAPNAFSPDGDGINDTWIPIMHGEKSFTVIIYDIFNNVVYTTSDENLPWNGANAKAGDTFTWKAILKDSHGDQSNYQGLVTIME